MELTLSPAMLRTADRLRAGAWATLWTGLLAAAIVVADQLTKWAVLANFAYGERLQITGFLNLVLVYNKGAAFGLRIGEDSRWFFVPVTIIALALLWVLFKQAKDNDHLRVVSLSLVVAGADGRAFAAGTDISLFDNFRTESDALAYEGRMDRVLSAVERCPVPTIAAISGACTGGGAAIAAACDLRIAAANMRFGFPIARTLGNCLSIANLARLVALIGFARKRPERTMVQKLANELMVELALEPAPSPGSAR